jgi:hypothetical protein
MRKNAGFVFASLLCAIWMIAVIATNAGGQVSRGVPPGGDIPILPNNGPGQPLGGDNSGAPGGGLSEPLGIDVDLRGSDGRGGGGGGGGGPTPRPVIPYVAAVCGTTKDFTRDCLEQSATGATFQLGRAMLGEYWNERAKHQVDIQFPGLSSRITQFELLIELEHKAIDMVKEKLDDDSRRLSPFPEDSPEHRRQKEKVVQWESETRQGADCLSHWTEVKDKDGTHRFDAGSAYEQLKEIGAGGWNQ